MIRGIKYFFLSIVFITAVHFATFAQASSKKIVAPHNWYELDRAETGYNGISLDKAYQLLAGRKSKTVVVAVIDTGIDTTQEDLKPVLWHNPGEIPGNGTDDDHNGYVDDIYGWNFNGGKDGRNVHEGSMEAARVYWKLHEKYGDSILDTNSMEPDQKWEYKEYLRAKEKVVGSAADPKEIMFMQRILPVLQRGDSIIAKDLGMKEFNGNDLKAYSPKDIASKTAASIYLNMCQINDDYTITNQDILDELKGQIRKAESAVKPPEDFRGEIVKDNENDINDRYYGNNDVMAGTPTHGTHCSGIIGAARNNGIGVDGIANDVKIMMVRAFSGGDEYDKDVANAIRYAVDNGAQVISMSFGKYFSPQKSWVDDAVRYAQSKDVLLLHAAGNDHKDIDSLEHYPSPVYLNNAGRATNFITVGASGDPTNGGFTAYFSNYGKNEVDVFAPGVNIYSTLPGGNKYGEFSGTSMACPVVAGVAALILEYFPDLSAAQLKYVIEKSVTPIAEKVILPGTQKKAGGNEESEMVNFSDISKSGGVVNVYEAVRLANTLKGDRNKSMKINLLPKSKADKVKKG